MSVHLLFWLIIGKREWSRGGQPARPMERAWSLVPNFLLFAKVLFDDAKKPDKINMIEANIPQREFKRLQISFLSEKSRDPVLVLVGLIRFQRTRKSRLTAP